MPRALAAVVVAALGAPMAWAGQGAQPDFRLSVDAIEIDAFVTDRDGNPVTDLTIDDFEILEEGVPQAITSLSYVDVPIPGAAAREPAAAAIPVEPDVQSNQRSDGRLYVLALDEIPGDLALRTRHFLRGFLERHFAPGDTAAVVYVGRGNAAATQDFTGNARLLLEAVDRFGGGFGPDLLSARSRMAHLRELLEFMGTLRGRRKSLILVTRGIAGVYDVLDRVGGEPSVMVEELHGALAAATRGNVSIYPIDPAGLSPGGALGEAESAPSPDTARLLRLAAMEGAMELRALGEATGGFALVNSNDFDGTFARIVRENSAYYVLGFTSNLDRRDGRYHRLDVRVSRPGLRVRGREGYVAPLPTATDPPAPPPGALATTVARSLRLPVSDRLLPLAVFAAPYRGDGRVARVALAVEMGASGLELIDTGETVDGVVEVVALAVDASGRRRTGRQYRMELRLRPFTYTRAMTHGFRVLGELELPPGRYQLRVGAGNVSGRNAGSVVHDLEVPDFTRDGLLLSGVTLTSVGALDAVTSAPEAPLGDVLPAPPTTARTFDRGDTITLYVEAYDQRRQAAAPEAALTVELRDPDGLAVRSAVVERLRDGAEGTHRFRAHVPLDVEPGPYVIHVEARGGGRATATGEVGIAVEQWPREPEADPSPEAGRP